MHELIKSPVDRNSTLNAGTQIERQKACRIIKMTKLAAIYPTPAFVQYADMFSQTRCRKLLIHPPYSSYNSQGTQTAAKHPPTHLTVLTHSLTNRLDSNRIGYTSSGNFKSDLHILVFIFFVGLTRKNWLSVISHLLQCPPNVIQYPGYVCQLLCYWNGI